MFLNSTTIEITDKGVLKFSPRQRQVLKLIADGAENKIIARVLHISLGTTIEYTNDIYTRLGVKGHKAEGMNLRAAALTLAFSKGLITACEKEGA